jgi:hypothetical protein
MSTGMNSSLSVDWTGVLAQFGVYPVKHRLPAVVRCPYCEQSQRYIYADTGAGGPWTTCDGCQLHGDVIELAAACWKLDPYAAVERLIEAGIEVGTVLASEQSRHVQTRLWARNRAIQAFWKEAQLNFVEGLLERAEHLYAGLGFTGTLHRTARENLSHIVGTVTRQALISLGRLCSGTTRQIFPETELSELLAVPFCDLPGRIVGFMAIGETGGKESKVLHTYAPLSRRRNAGIGNLGVWHHAPIKDLGESVYLLDDVGTYLRLHSRHARATHRRLPVMLSTRGHIAHTDRFSASLPRRPIIVLGHESHAAELFRLAYMTGGAVAHHRDLNENSCADPPQFLKQMRQCSLPWDIRLRTVLGQSDAVAIATIFNSINLSNADMVQFIAHTPKPLQARLSQLGVTDIADRVVDIAGHSIRCTPHGWYEDEKQLSDVDIRFDKRVFLKSGRLLYTGSVVRDTQVWPIRFIDRRHGGGLFRRVALLLQSYGVPVNMNRGWSQYALQTALTAHPPTDHKNIDQVGWDDDAAIFRLPKFTVGLGGKVQVDAVTAFPTNPPTPAAAIPPPSLVSGTDFVEIKQQTAAQLFWAITGAVLQNVVAPALNLRPAGIVLTGEGRNGVGRKIAEGIGCVALERATARTPRKQLRHWLEYHRWPLLIDASPKSSERHRDVVDWLETDGPKSIIVLADETTACSLATRGWLVLNCDRGLTFSTPALEAGRRIISSYLHDLCIRQGRTHTPMQCARETILVDLSYWHRNLTGEALRLEHVRRQSPYGAHRPVWFGFVDLIGLLAVSSTRLVTDQKTAVWISFDELSRLLSRRKAPMLDVEAITRELHAAGVLLSNYDAGGKYGWLIAKPWWESRYKKHRNSFGTPYRLPVDD